MVMGVQNLGSKEPNQCTFWKSVQSTFFDPFYPFNEIQSALDSKKMCYFLAEN